MILKRIALLVFLFFAITSLNAQRIEGDNYGGMIGLNLTFGSTVNRVGLVVKGYFVQNDKFQYNLDACYHFNMSSYGPPFTGQEWILKGGFVWAWSDELAIENPFLSSVSNQLGKKNSVGYSINYYWDEIGTHQSTGTVSVQLDRLNFIMENDAFFPPPADKFRTAAATFTYRLQEATYVSVNTIMWTGDPFTDMIDTKTNRPHYPSRYGFRDMSKARYGNFSHGILSIGIQQLMPYEQDMRLNLGIDSEWVRHILQNKIIHDLYFIPDFMNLAKHPHIPILADDGTQYLFYPHQKVKPLSMYGQLSVNGTLFY